MRVFASSAPRTPRALKDLSDERWLQRSRLSLHILPTSLSWRTQPRHPSPQAIARSRPVGPLAAAFRPSGRRRLSPLAHTVSAGDPLPAQRDALFWVSGRAPVVQLDRVISRLAGANAHYSIYRCDPYLAIANGPSTSMLGDRGYNAVGSSVRDNDVELDLG